MTTLRGITSHRLTVCAHLHSGGGSSDEDDKPVDRVAEVKPRGITNEMKKNRVTHDYTDTPESLIALTARVWCHPVSASSAIRACICASSSRMQRSGEWLPRFDTMWPRSNTPSRKGSVGTMREKTGHYAGEATGIRSTIVRTTKLS